MIKSQRQTGLSLVELMIALAISSFLILGITQVYIDNQRHYLFQQSQSSNLDSGRFAALILDQYLGKAGYRRNPSITNAAAFPARSASGGCLAFVEGASITGLSSDEGMGFCIRYQPQVSAELDCQGAASGQTYTKSVPDAPLAPSNLIVQAFKYEPGTGTELQNGRLLCKSLNAPTPQFTEQLTGIADMRIDFGLAGTAADKSVASFVAQSSWTAASNPILSVRYSLLLASRAGQRDTADRPTILENWLALAPSATKTRLQNGDNRRVYQVVSSTRTVRNLMP